MDERQRVAISEFISDRTPRPLTGPVLSFNLPQEIAALRAEVEYAKGHNGRTLIKNSDFRLVLVALQQGAQLHEHRTDLHLAVQPLSGHLRVHLPDEVVNLHPDQLLSLGRDQTYSIEAVEPTEFLLWVGWSNA